MTRTVASSRVSGFLRALALALGVAGAGVFPALAQTGPATQTDPAPQSGGGANLVPSRSGQIMDTPSGTTGQVTLTAGTAETEASAAPDYAAWEKVATRTEATLADPNSSAIVLEQLRAQLADWREALLVAQSTNSTRIATLRTQIASLGPVPAEGETEADEIVARRKELNEQLVRLQAPGIAAEEAYSRADGLIREIDRVLRERQADELLRLRPSPINPANWPAALTALSDAAVGLYGETAANWNRASARAQLFDNLPLIAALLLIALGILWRGRRWMENVTQRLQEHASARGGRLWALLVSLGQIILPTLGVLALAHAMKLTGMLGIVGTVIADALPVLGFGIFAANWLGGQMFPRAERADPHLNLSPERRAEARFHVASFGWILGLEGLRQVALDPVQVGEAAMSVLTFPILTVAGLLLLRLGQMLLRHVRRDTAEGEAPGFRNRLIGLLGRGAIAIGVVGPLLAAVGYIAAATAMVYPAAVTLGLVGLLFILQQVIADLYVMVTRNAEAGREALIPVLIGFVLTLATLPLFALIWGARLADITELWTRFREGFQLGETRISPTDFLLFAVLFGFGYGVTRLFQGALKSTILPKTSLDQGGQNAIVAGVGYVGIFLAGLIAINSAGIDLSGLAIVAGALSVGIGFGLQNIVSNFVSGIILLIERPVAEGDWIEVGGVQGTVKAISVRSTRIQTFDRNDVIVPNSDLIAGQVTNWTHYNLSGRLIVPIGVAYGSDTLKVERILREIAEAQPLAVLNPPPTIAFMGFGTDALNFEIRVILRDVNFSLSVRTAINHEIARRFAEEGVDMPFAQRDLWLRNPEAIVEAIRGASQAAAQPAPVPPRDAGPADPRDPWDDAQTPHGGDDPETEDPRR